MSKEASLRIGAYIQIEEMQRRLNLPSFNWQEARLILRDRRLQLD
ncbi:MAG TPA: hypothetical protein PKU99_10365 [Candidatus Saccharicenans sp.]|nr:hypothetical protein [Candidatus Saccharicenans sp.]HPU94515.1 hypothetical protein [Candidatus Saccharicenans sp.]